MAHVTGRMGKYSTAQYSTAQYSTAQYSTAQYSTAQYSTVQYSTVITSKASHLMQSMVRLSGKYRYNCERSKLSSVFNGQNLCNIIISYIYIFQVVRRSVYVLNVYKCI